VQVTIMDMHVRLARAGDRERMLSVWERSVRATHHFLAERDIIGLTRAGGRFPSCTCAAPR
jgi:hypothetical protein